MSEPDEALTHGLYYTMTIDMCAYVATACPVP